jgi:hypothetical protein
MNFKKLLIIVVILGIGFCLSAKQSVTFLKDGNKVTDTIIDMSSRTGHVEYSKNLKVHKNRIWMINYENKNWDFANERKKLSTNKDTIFVKNGDILKGEITDFSSRRMVWEFSDGRKIHESKVKRIYFCCEELPKYYAKQSKPSIDEILKTFESNTFLRDGKVNDEAILYLNSRKTGFYDGLQINTKDIWMINLENDKWDFPNERREMQKLMPRIYSKKHATIFLTNGRIVHDSLVDFKLERQTFLFQDIDPIHFSKIKRIYFCCNPLPQAYKSNPGGRKVFRKIKR